ncbi:MAG: iron-containing alcohol dehydrogenase [Spirochaetota bacterium]|nr:MAG: iron-containing alcohol dehydrogenase [Spirochaetota bacterium]
MEYKQKAKEMLQEWKGENYAFGMGVLDKIGGYAQKARKTTMLVVTGWKTEKWVEPLVKEIEADLSEKGIKVVDIIRGARANAPREDVYRIANQIGKKKPDSIIGIGGGSTIDAVKCASVLATFESDDVEKYFGMGLVTETVKNEGKKVPTIIAVQTASSSAAHLTKYSNITDPLTGQKKLIIDEAVVPPYAVFDYSTTINAPYAIKADGALDGIAHCLEVMNGATGKPFFDRTMDIAEAGIGLIVQSLPKAIDSPEDSDAVEALGLGTDLGGYAIMVGGTNYGHLFSFSVVNKLTHGRACAITNPYTLIFFAPAIEAQLRLLGGILKKEGYISEEIDNYKDRDLSVAVANGMLKFSEAIKFPTTFGEVGIDDEDKKRILTAAKNPQLWSKLEQAPVSLIAKDKADNIDKNKTEGNIDRYMGALIDGIISGDFNKIENMPQ